MSLMRSALGLKNKPKFHSVDAVVYVEGGSSNDGSGKPIQSLDIVFWRGLFAYFKPDSRFRFEAQGGKERLMKIADTIAGGGVEGNYVAIDSDFDVIFGEKRDYTFLFYTYGYAWENDIFSPEVLRSTFFIFCPACTEQFDISEQIDELISDLTRQLRWLVVADFLMAALRRPFIPRKPLKAHREFLSPKQGHGRPSIDRRRVKGRLRATNNDRNGKFSPKRKLKLHPLKNCFGHLMGTLFCKTVMHFVRRYGTIGSIEYQVILSCGIDRFVATFGSVDGDLIEHYTEQFNRI